MAKIIHILPHNIEDFMAGDYENFDHHSVRFLSKVAKFWMVSSMNKLEQELWMLSKDYQQIKEFRHKSGFKLKLFPISLNLPLPLEISWALLKEVRRYKSESGVVWHLHSYYLFMNDLLAVILRLKKQKFVMHYRGGGPSWTSKAFLYTIYHYLIGLRLVLNLANYILAQNHDEERRVVNFLGVKQKKVIYFPNSVPLDSLVNIVESSGKEQFKIIMAGRVDKLTSRLARMKVIGEILRKNKNCILEIIGVKDIIGLRRCLIGIDEARLILTHWLDQTALLSKLKDADLFLHVNDKDEGSPMMVIEAQSQGVPVVAIDIEGVRDIIRDGFNGYLVKEINDLPAKMAALDVNHQLTELSLNAIQMIRGNFTDKKYFPKLIKIYQDLLVN